MRLNVYLALGLALAACAPPPSTATVTPVALMTPVLIPTVTSAASAATEVAATEAPPAATPTPSGPLFTVAPGDEYTLTKTAEVITLTYRVSETNALAAYAVPVGKEAGAGQPINEAAIKAVEEQVGFTLKQPAWLPSGYLPRAGGLVADLQKKSVQLGYYAIWGDKQYVFLYVTQQQVPTEVPPSGAFSVGASAKIEPVQIGETAGAYVSGAWNRLALEPTGERWKWLNLAQPTHAALRWDQAGFRFEILFTGECWQYLCGDKDTLVKIAESLP